VRVTHSAKNVPEASGKSRVMVAAAANIGSQPWR